MTAKPQRFTARHGLVLAFVGAFGASLFALGMVAHNDHRILGERGVVTTATIVDLHRNSADIRFTTGAGERSPRG